MTEAEIQNQIRAKLSPYAILFRVNVGSGKTNDGRYFSTRVPKGYSDLSGFRKSDGKAVFIEVKKPGGSVRLEQENFIKQMRENGAIAGIAHSVEEALEILNGGN